MSLTQINKAGLDEIALDHVFTIGASGSSAYTFQGEGLNGTVNNPTLYLTRGKTYRFENGSGGHPIRIQSTSGASGTAYNTGVTNNAGSGTVIVEVQHDAPDVLYYQCTSHAAMNGILYITGALADGGVTTAKIAAGAVTEAKLATNAVTTDKINSGVITNAKLAANAVGTANIANDAVNSDKLANGAVDTDQIANNAVRTTKINDENVTTSKLANNAVTTGKIADQAVTLAKLEHGTSSNDGKFLRANNGADPTFETVSGTTINNNADNRVITGSATANTLNGESNFTVDSSGNVTIVGSPGVVQTLKSAGSTYGGALSLINTASPSDYRWDIAVGGGDGAYILGRGLLVRSITDSKNVAGFQTDGNVLIHDGNLKLASGHGIDFSSTTDYGTGSNRAELLDDYEEGQFEPSFSTPNGQILKYTYRGEYCKIGRVVHCMWSISSNGTSGTTSGQVTITGFPFSGEIPSASGPRGGGGVIYGGYGSPSTLSRSYIQGTTLYILLNDGSHLEVSDATNTGGNAFQMSGMITYLTTQI